MSEIVHANSETFDQLINSGSQPVLVDFWASWCGPCKAMSPVLEILADEYSEKLKIIKVNVDDNADLAHRFGIRALPTLSIIDNGSVVNTIIGMGSKQGLSDFIEDAISS